MRATRRPRPGPLRAAVAAALIVGLGAASPAAAQTGRLRIDFGDDTLPTGSSGGVWNDVDDLTSGQSHALLYETGAASGIQLDFTPGMVSTTANTSGVVTPDPGSPLQALGWPASATRDSLYGSTFPAAVEFTLSGLDPTATYDFLILGSRLGASDSRTVLYTAAGANTGSAVLDVSNNASAYVRIDGIRPDGSNAIVFRYKAAPTNTNPSKFFYLNALGIDEWSGGSQPPLVSFGTNRVDVSRVIGKGPFATTIPTYSNDGTTPALAITAVLPGTQIPPAWLAIPASGTAGSDLPITVDGDALAPGTYTAHVTATAPGYQGSDAKIVLVVREPGALNILFYGNSYTIVNSVHTLVQALAEQAGFDPPNVVGALVGGQDLDFHLNEPGQAAAIAGSLTLGEEWDYVVLQGFSLEATVALGDPQGFKADALAIVTNVKAHSPGARACLYQTWARAPGHSVYPSAFSSPLVMHQQIEASYTQAVAEIDAAFGPDTARRAAAGEAVALRAWDPAMYDPDLSHPGPLMSTMAADTIFTAIYGVRACSLDPDLDAGGNLAGKLLGFGMDEQDWEEAAGLADRAADAQNRLHPGSREDLLLRTAVSFPLTACPLKSAAPLAHVGVRLTTPAATYRGEVAWIQADLFPTGFPPGPAPGMPEIHYDAATSWVLVATPDLGPALDSSLVLEPWTAGRSLLLQGYVLAPSAKTGNPFTTTDAHEVQIGPLRWDGPKLVQTVALDPAQVP